MKYYQFPYYIEKRRNKNGGSAIQPSSVLFNHQTIIKYAPFFFEFTLLYKFHIDIFIA
jgi:hypothetical protein